MLRAEPGQETDSSFMPETLRSLVGDGSIPPPPLSMSPGMYWHQRQMEKERKARGEEIEHVERPPAKRVRDIIIENRYADRTVSTLERILDLTCS